ncbi:MAG: DUF4834 family protein [Muribaculaceae bacterium]
MDLLLIILLFIVLYPLLRIAFSIWRQVHHMKKQIRDIREQFDEVGKSQSRYYNRNSSYSDDDDEYSRSRRTQYVQNMGEYVDYEEIVEERESIAYDPDVPTEPQITDARYEEID